jgi:hypothetical protein
MFLIVCDYNISARSVIGHAALPRPTTCQYAPGVADARGPLCKCDEIVLWK